MEPHEQEIRQLRRLLRDLVALSTTPAIWVGRDLPHIADGLADILLHTLRADAVYVAIHSDVAIEKVRAEKHPGFKAEVERLRTETGHDGFVVESAILSTWASQLRIAIYPIGLSRNDGFVAVGCSDADFPGESESLLLSVAANQAAVAVQTARLRARTEGTLAASQRLAAIVETSDDAIVSKDLNGIVTSWNPAAERMFGFAAKEMIGRSIRILIPRELQDDEDRILATIARGERIEHFETVRLTKSGQRIDVSLTVSPVKDEAGRIVGAAKIARDITQRKKTETALRTTERLAAVGRLAATVAHEINNPLEAVINLVFLAKETAVRDDVRLLLAQADEEIGRISQLTKQTLGFYRDTNTVTAVKMGALLDPLISAFAPRMRNKGVEICPEILGDPEIQAIPGEMRQLLANLLSNSMDAVEEGGQIHIRVSARDGSNGRQPSGVRVTVADSGAGIPAAVREHIFEPFFTTKKDVGTGLGLWVCKNIVDKHHGSIRLKSSTAVGKSWTVISVFLPSVAQGAIQEALMEAV